MNKKQNYTVPEVFGVEIHCENRILDNSLYTSGSKQEDLNVSNWDSGEQSW